MIKYVGHDRQANRSYIAPPQPLVKACLRYLDSVRWNEEERTQANYERAVDAARGITCSSIEANMLLLEPPLRQHPESFALGLFVSALYNNAPEDIIIYDFDVEAHNLGYKAKKILVNQGTVTDFGPFASNLVINCGRAEMPGHGVKTTLVNTGTLGTYDLCSSGICINANHRGKWVSFSINTEVGFDIMMFDPWDSVPPDMDLVPAKAKPEILEYVNDVLGAVEKLDFKKYRENPGKTIRDAILRML